VAGKIGAYSDSAYQPIESVSGFGHSAGADTAGANPHAFVGLSINDPDSLKIGIPASSRQIVGVANPVPIDRAFVTDLAARHEDNLPHKIDGKYSIRS
jgi:hypothetical protein